MKNVKYKGILFDIDGTLTFTNQLIFNSFNFIAEKFLNKRFSDKEIISMFGPTEDYILEKLFPENFEEVRNTYYDYYKSNHKIAGLYDGIRELILDLHSLNLVLGIFTGKGRTSSLITLDYFGLTKYFHLIVTGDDVINHKPSAEGILKFVDHFNLKKEEVLMIGDSPSDIKASRDAGVEIATVVWDSYSKDAVVEMNSKNIIKSVDELRKFIFNSTPPPKKI